MSPKGTMRHDHTDWITHFVRDRLPEQDFPGVDERETDIALHQ